MVEDIARTPKICASLEGRKVDHQSTMIEIKGKILAQPVSIMIDPVAYRSYVSPKIVENCKLHKTRLNKPSMYN